jgi:hypothetical protein
MLDRVGVHLMGSKEPVTAATVRARFGKLAVFPSIGPDGLLVVISQPIRIAQWGPAARKYVNTHPGAASQILSFDLLSRLRKSARISQQKGLPGVDRPC